MLRANSANMALGQPVDNGQLERTSQSYELQSSLEVGADWHNQPLQTYCPSVQSNEQHQLSALGHIRDALGSSGWLLQTLTDWFVGSKESTRLDSTSEATPAPARNGDVVHESLSRGLATTFESLSRRPLTDVLTCQEIIVVLGGFMAERLLYRGITLPGDPVAVTVVDLLPESFASRSPLSEHTYKHCLAFTPEPPKWSLSPPTATLRMIRCLTARWPQSLKTTDRSETIHQPSWYHWRWLHEEKKIISIDVVALNLDPFGPTLSKRVRGVVTTEAQLTGSIWCVFILADSY